MAAAREAKEHMALAEKALKTSWIGLKFAPDHLSASMEFANAATKFRSANMMEYAVAAWVRSAEMKEKLSDLFGAGRAYESAGAICDGTGPGGPKAAAKNWEKAIRCFRLCAKGDIAAKLILKRAESLEKDGDVDGAKVAFEEAIEVFKEDEKDYQLGDVYKQYIGFLVRSNRVDDTAKAMDGHVEILVRNKHYPFAHKELLAKAVLFLSVQDVVRADQALQPGIAVEGWFMSKESQVGSELVQAFQANDAESAERLLKEQAQEQKPDVSKLTLGAGSIEDDSSACWRDLESQQVDFDALSLKILGSSGGFRRLHGGDPVGSNLAEMFADAEGLRAFVQLGLGTAHQVGQPHVVNYEAVVVRRSHEGHQRWLVSLAFSFPPRPAASRADAQAGSGAHVASARVLRSVAIHEEEFAGEPPRSAPREVALGVVENNQRSADPHMMRASL